MMSSETALTLAQQQKIAELEEHVRALIIFANPLLPSFDVYKNRKMTRFGLMMRLQEQNVYIIRITEDGTCALFGFSRNRWAPKIKVTISKTHDTITMEIGCVIADVYEKWFTLRVGPGYITIREAPVMCARFGSLLPLIKYTFGSKYVHGAVRIDFPKAVVLDFEQHLREFLDVPCVRDYFGEGNIIWK